MAIRGDIGGHEKSYLRDMLPKKGAHILEIGCGAGRLTRKYADLAAPAVGIDLPAALPATGFDAAANLMRVAAASAVALPFRDRCFDTAIFALSF